MAFQLFRGTDAQVAGYNGADGEIVYNMTNKSLHVFDGVTAGGFELKNAEAMKQELLAGATTAYDTLKEIEDYINANEGSVGTILTNMTTMQNQINANEGNIGSLLTDLSTKAPKPAAPSNNGEFLTWDGSNFANTVLGMTRTDDGVNTTFTFS